MSAFTDVLNEIDSEMKQIQGCLIDPFYDRQSRFVINTRVSKPTDFITCDIWEWFTLLCYENLSSPIAESIREFVLNNEGTDDNFFITKKMQEMKDIGDYTNQIVATIKDLVDPMPTSDLISLVALAEKNVDFVNKYLTDGLLACVTKLSIARPKDISSLKSLVERYGKDSLIKFYEIMGKHKEMLIANLLIVLYYKVCVDKNKIIDDLVKRNITSGAERKAFLRLNKDSKNDTIKEECSDFLGKPYEDVVVEIFTSMKEWTKNSAVLISSTKKSNKKKISTLDRILRLLNSYNEKPDQEITNISDLIKGLDSDSKLRVLILKWVYEHNMAIYRKLIDQHNTLTAEGKSDYLLVLEKYQLVLTNEEISEVSNNITSSEMNEIIRTLKLHGFDDNRIIKVLKTTNFDLYSRIIKYLQSGYYSSMFLKDNIDFFSFKSNLFSKYENSLELLSQFQINPKLFELSTEVLLNNYELLEKNILILKDYSLLSCLKTSNDLSFLLDESLENKIDLFIELGLIEVLENNIGLLNLNDLKIKRLKALYMINGFTFFDEDGTPLMEWDKLFELINQKSFFMNEEEIDECLSSLSLLKIDLDLFDLDKYKLRDSRIMMIGGSIFSNNKIKRKLEDKSDIYTALFFNKLCSDEEYERIMEELKPFQKKYE